MKEYEVNEQRSAKKYYREEIKESDVEINKKITRFKISEVQFQYNQEGTTNLVDFRIN